MVKNHIIVHNLIFVVRNCSDDATHVQSKSEFFEGLTFSSQPKLFEIALIRWKKAKSQKNPLLFRASQM